MTYAEFLAADKPKIEPIHPETMRELRQMVKLHGASRLITAIKQISFEAVL